MKNDSDLAAQYAKNRTILLLLFCLSQIGVTGFRLLGAQVAILSDQASYPAISFAVNGAGIFVLILGGIQIDRHGPRRIGLLLCYALMILYACVGLAIVVEGGLVGLWLLALTNVLFYVSGLVGAVLILRMIPHEKIPRFNVLWLIPVQMVSLSSIAFVVSNRVAPLESPLGGLLMLSVCLVATAGCARILSRLEGEGISERGLHSIAILKVFDPSAKTEEQYAGKVTNAFSRLWRDVRCRCLCCAGIAFTTALGIGAQWLIYPETYAFTTDSSSMLFYLAFMTCGMLLGAICFYLACVRNGLGFGAFLVLSICLSGAILCLLFKVHDGLGSILAVIVLQACLTAFTLSVTTLFQRIVPVTSFGRVLALYYASMAVVWLAFEFAVRSFPEVQTAEPYIFTLISGIALLAIGIGLLFSPLVRKEAI